MFWARTIQSTTTDTTHWRLFRCFCISVAKGDRYSRNGSPFISPYICIEQSKSHRTDIHKFYIWKLYKNFIFCWPCIVLWFSVNDQLDAQFFSMYLFQFSTCFEPRRRWEDNIKMDLQEVGGNCGNWMERAQDRGRWRTLVNTVMNFRVP
jgi:hypothetical protein